MTIVPPIKSQGIKTKLVSWIQRASANHEFDRWVEPFMGTGVVAFNVQPKRALMCDSNPHLIRFYKAIQSREITSEKAKHFLTTEGLKLLQTEGEHYYKVRERFNSEANPLDFLFLSRSCFNGMMRFNRKGGYNVPFCRKPSRFAQALVTKITNQIANVSFIIENGEYEFRHQEFKDTLSEVQKGDFVYCDPPYIGRHVDYFDSWSEEDERELNACLLEAKVSFIMSTWLKNKYRHNEFVFSLWGECSILIKEHFYHVGAKEDNRNAVFEALLMNYKAQDSKLIANVDVHQIDAQTSEVKHDLDRQKRMAV